MRDFVVAVGGADSGVSPLMPFIGERFSGKFFAWLAGLKLETALLRSGLDICDCSKAVTDSQEIIFQANRNGADCIVIMTYSAFGSRKSFNDVGGATVKYPPSRQSGKSRVLAEDICAKLGTHCATAPCDWTWAGAAGPVSVVSAGYLTMFDEAKRSVDPDFAEHIAEHAAMGICEYLGTAYVPSDDFSAYSDICQCALGKRGKKVKLLQTLLAANGYDVAVDGIYGKATDLAVRTLCINNDKPDRTTIDEDVLHDLLLQGVPYLPLGSKHNAVLYVRRKLRAKLYGVEPTGALDEKVITAVDECLTESGYELSVSDGYGVTPEAVALLSPIGGGKPRLF